MTYEQAIDWLFSQLPNYQKIGNEAYKPGFKNILSLMDLYGNPHHKIKTIHIAGTNGKGSTSHSVASILQEAGFKVGLFTSPHLKKFTERIRINGIECNEEFIHENIIKLKARNLSEQPSFFELTTALAFKYFAENKVDIAVIEVGLGGTLDSTNIIIPEVCAITSISYDHQDILGDTLEEICLQKAGIIKPSIPVVIGEKNPVLIDLIQNVAIKHNSKAVVPNFEFKETDLKGNYQVQNQNTVLGIINELKFLGWGISENAINEGLKNIVKNTNLRGRWEILNNQPLIICDTGHNEAGLKQIITQLNELNKPLIFLLGFVKGKKIEEIIRLLPQNAHYVFTQPSIFRALSPLEYEELLKNYTLNYEIIEDINKAYNVAKQLVNTDEVLFIGGSTFVVSDILEEFY